MPCTRIYWTSQNDIISPEETEETETECELSASESDDELFNWRKKYAAVLIRQWSILDCNAGILYQFLGFLESYLITNHCITQTIANKTLD